MKFYKVNNEFIESRHNLILLLERLSKKYGWICINPTKLMIGNQSELLVDDMAHYSPQGVQEMGRIINKTLNTVN